MAAAVLMWQPGVSSEATSERAANTDRVFESDIEVQQAQGLALADAGMLSALPEVRRVAGELLRLEPAHSGNRVPPARPGPRRVATNQQRFVSEVRDHLQADILIARIERSDGRDGGARRRASSVIAAARSALASLEQA